jgi:hypothetical protein
MNDPVPAFASLDEETAPDAAWRRFVLPVAGAAVLVTAAVLWTTGRTAAATAVCGGMALLLGMAAGIAVLRMLLTGSNGIVAVARTVVEEAVGTRAPILLVMLIVVGLPALPLVLDSSERLEYRVQFFLTWSLSGGAFLLSLITILLATSSVCGDIESQRIHMTLVKPLERWQYLLGKWLGIVLLDLVLVGVLGIGVYAGAEALRRSPGADAVDRRAVDEQVFTARSVARPVHPRGKEFDATVNKAIEQLEKDDPAAFRLDPAAARKRILAQHVLEWHTVSADVVASYVFEKLDVKRQPGGLMQLRLKPFADNVSMDRADVRFAVWLNDRPYPVRNGKHEEYTLKSLTFHTLDIPVAAVDDSGTLRVTIANRNLVPAGETRATSISFSPGKGLELLYRVGGFTDNFLRGLAVIWAKLGLLAAAALAAASWLSFPIAVLVGLMVYLSAVARAFLADAIDIYTGLDLAGATLTSMVRLRLTLLLERLAKLELWDAWKTIMSYAADIFLALVPSFAAHDGITEVATGRVLPAMDMLASCGELAVLYPFGLLLLGWLLLERRDLVNVSGS